MKKSTVARRGKKARVRAKRGGPIINARSVEIRSMGAISSDGIGGCAHEWIETYKLGTLEVKTCSKCRDFRYISNGVEVDLGAAMQARQLIVPFTTGSYFNQTVTRAYSPQELSNLMGGYAADGSGQQLGGLAGNGGLMPRAVGLRPGVMPKLDLLNEPRKPRVITLEDDEQVSEDTSVPREGGS